MDPHWDLIGNERAVRALQAGLAGGAANHAYLFAGPDGTGRAAAAKRLAQALNCTGAEPPCGECAPCRRIEGGIHADVQTLTIATDAEGAVRKAISVEQVREMEAAVALAPYEGRTRVVVIDPADAMSDGAQNAFLKTLEEPPPNAVFVLIAGNEERLLETVRSRCRRIEFRLVPASEIEAALVAQGVEGERARLLARLSGGRPGWALEAAASPRLLERRNESLGVARELPRLPLADRLDLAEKLSEAFKRDREPVMRQLDEWAGWWRDVLLAASGAGESIANVDETASLQADAGECDRAEVARFVQAIIDTRGYLAENVQSRIALDALMLAVPGRALSRARQL
ncbi:MAG TPA: DNA polymerase III subunit delta' [Dehalococcoidia bacterium]|nr:DNA polymerase III subunit delta' [Dehalococcoidia bacterium]